MSDNNQAYVKRCGECNRSVEKLTLTKVRQDERSTVLKPLCDECKVKYE